MSAPELKAAFHQLIDGISDENCLQDLYDSAHVFVANRFTPVIDDESENIRMMLQQSLKNLASGHFLTTEELRKEIASWPRKK